MKKVKSKATFNHTSKSQKGMGDFYGSGVRNKVGKIREVTGFEPIAKSKIGKPPKALA